MAYILNFAIHQKCDPSEPDRRQGEARIFRCPVSSLLVLCISATSCPSYGIEHFPNDITHTQPSSCVHHPGCFNLKETYETAITTSKAEKRRPLCLLRVVH
eukprot:scaffold4940_cov163-Amphora_coffeaeformis.AAC.9